MNIKLKTHLFIFFLISVIHGINFGQKGTNYKKGLYTNVGTIIKMFKCTYNCNVQMFLKILHVFKWTIFCPNSI